MFPEGSPDMNSLLEQAAAMQQQLLAAQEDLANRRVDGSAGGGLVTATVTGTGDLVGLLIQPDACDPADPETLADLVLAAVRDATSNAQEQAAEQMGQLTGGFGEGLGLGLGGPAPDDEGGQARPQGPAGFLG
jgi:nucleoid-associated protein EbfC